MSYVCFRCRKKKMRGNLVAHSNRRTKRDFAPNLHIFWIKAGNKRVRAKFCTKCLRIVKKQVSQVSEVPQVSHAT